jgi:hypothetical protein
MKRCFHVPARGGLIPFVKRVAWLIAVSWPCFYAFFIVFFCFGGSSRLVSFATNLSLSPKSRSTFIAIYMTNVGVFNWELKSAAAFYP